mmetsp:Transcript_77610/g.227578  ORF Transcript_77610/g.227578 Transcript_77610/m.227578 type:complete len:249 (-) Transcript_77610:892-1638(-)
MHGLLGFLGLAAGDLGLGRRPASGGGPPPREVRPPSWRPVRPLPEAHPGAELLVRLPQADGRARVSVVCMQLRLLPGLLPLCADRREHGYFCLQVQQLACLGGHDCRRPKTAPIARPLEGRRLPHGRAVPALPSGVWRRPQSAGEQRPLAPLRSSLDGLRGWREDPARTQGKPEHGEWRRVRQSPSSCRCDLQCERHSGASASAPRRHQRRQQEGILAVASLCLLERVQHCVLPAREGRGQGAEGRGQ